MASVGWKRKRPWEELQSNKRRKVEREINSEYEDDDDDDDIIGEECKWKDLSPELVEMIFEKVGLKEKILNLPFVCKSWHKAVRSPQCWKSLNFQYLGGPLDHFDFNVRFRLTYHTNSRYFFSGLLKLLASLGGAAVQELVFSEMGQVTADDLAYTAKKCPEVKTLALPMLADDKRFPSIISEWKSLERLHMARIPWKFVEIVERLGANCKNLVELKTSGEISDRVATAIVGFLPKIRRLYFYDSCFSEKHRLMLLEGCKELQVLELQSGERLKWHDRQIFSCNTSEKFRMKRKWWVGRDI